MSGRRPSSSSAQSSTRSTHAIHEVLTPHQRTVLVALALNGVPIDVLADRLGSNRNALYKTLHDARRRLRRHLDDCGLAVDGSREES